MENGKMEKKKKNEEKLLPLGWLALGDMGAGGSCLAPWASCLLAWPPSLGPLGLWLPFPPAAGLLGAACSWLLGLAWPAALGRTAGGPPGPPALGGLLGPALS